MQPKISIIVPAYNTESYIRQCVNSVLSQQYDNWELIVVNDGSTDNTPHILDQYAKTDSRIHVIHQTNQGVQKAREIAVMTAQGDYLCFVDSDDTLASATSLQLMADQITSEDIILVIGRINVEREKRHKLLDAYLFTTTDTTTYLTYIFTGKSNWALCGKLYKTAYFRTLNKPEITVATAEDALYNIMYCSAHPQSKVAMVNKPVYNYLMRSNSVIHTQNPKHIYDNMIVADYIQTHFSISVPERYLIAFRLLCFSSSFRYGWLGHKHTVYAKTLSIYNQQPNVLTLFSWKKRLKIWLLIHYADFFSKYIFHNFVRE